MIEQAKAILKKIIYITIATASKDGQPWNSPVYSAFDEDYNFYWASWKENQHSKNIAENEKIFLVVYDSTAPEGTGMGVYVQAKAYALTDEEEIRHACSYLYGRNNKLTQHPEEFLGNYPRRVFKAVPEKFWMNDTGAIDGNFIDKRVEIKLT